MPVILETHGGTYRRRGPIANPRHHGKGYETVVTTANLTEVYRRRFREDGSDKLKLLLACEGYRCEEVLCATERAFFPPRKDEDSLIPPDVIIGKDWSLGDASSRRSKHGKVYTLGENIFQQEHCFGKTHFLARLSRWLEKHYSIVVSVKDLAWGDIEQIDLEYPGLKILCAGRNEMDCLGEASSFWIASAYFLNWQNKKAECFVKNGMGLF